MSASASPTTAQMPDPPEPMAPPEAGDTDGDQLFGTPLAASDAGAEPPKFDPTEEQNTQEGATTEGLVKGSDDDPGVEFSSMEVDYGTSEEPRTEEPEVTEGFLFSRAVLARTSGERVNRATEAIFVVSLDQDEDEQAGGFG